MAAWCSDNLRTVAAWRDEGLKLTTTSDEAAKLYDGLLRQVVSWTDCQELGGLMVTAEKMLNADPVAVMPRTITYALDVMSTGTSALVNEELAKNLEQLGKDAENRGSPWEQLHVKAIRDWADGYFERATMTWENILLEHPNDLMALKFAHDAYFFMGDKENIRDSIARVLPKWKGQMPCYSFLHGMYAFGLEECGEYRKAEIEAVTALEINRFDCWAAHAKAHVIEMEGRYEEGIRFLEGTKADWEPGWMLAAHNHWHNAVYYIERGDYESAVTIFDKEVSPRATKNGAAILDMVDGASLLLRLELEGIDVGDRWKRLPDMESHSTDHITAFNDVHYAAMFVKRGELETERKMYDSLVNFTKSSCNDNAKINELVGQELYEGLIAYYDEKFDEAAEKILPVRKRIYRIGGSHAQRDLFTQILVHACTQSKQEKNWKMTPIVLEERAKIRTGHSPLAERLALKFKALHPL